MSGDNPLSVWVWFTPATDSPGLCDPKLGLVPNWTTPVVGSSVVQLITAPVWVTFAAASWDAAGGPMFSTFTSTAADVARSPYVSVVRNSSW